MDVLLKVQEILTELQPDIDFATHKHLIDDVILDSFDIITLVGELNENFGIEIGVEELKPENFNSAGAICELIEKLKRG